MRSISLLVPIAGASVVAACAGPQHEQLELRSGRESFAAFCASCHGADARGNGPVAEFINVPVPDPTAIALRRGGTFPEQDVFCIVDGQCGSSVNGTRHMPVWGYEFFNAGVGDEEAHRESTRRIDLLVRYLGSIQRAE